MSQHLPHVPDPPSQSRRHCRGRWSLPCVAECAMHRAEIVNRSDQKHSLAEVTFDPAKATGAAMQPCQTLAKRGIEPLDVSGTQDLLLRKESGDLLGSSEQVTAPDADRAPPRSP